MYARGFIWNLIKPHKALNGNGTSEAKHKNIILVSMGAIEARYIQKGHHYVITHQLDRL